MKIKKLIKKLKAIKKAKKGTRYDWDRIPAVVMWAWQTSDGMLMGSEQAAEPILLETHFAALAEMKRILSDTFVLRPAKNWRKSLEKRPSKTTAESLARGFEQAERGPATLWEGVMNGDEPTRHAAELDTIAQTHEVLNYAQSLPVEPQEESETTTNGAEWVTVSKSDDGMFSMSVLKTTKRNDIDYLEWVRQHAGEATNQAFSGDPDSDLDSFLNYLSRHNGQKLTMIVCHDCHKVAIDTPSQMRKNNPFVFVHGWGWHCPSCAMEVGKS